MERGGGKVMWFWVIFLAACQETNSSSKAPVVVVALAVIQVQVSSVGRSCGDGRFLLLAAAERVGRGGCCSRFLLSAGAERKSCVWGGKMCEEEVDDSGGGSCSKRKVGQGGVWMGSPGKGRIMQGREFQWGMQWCRLRLVMWLEIPTLKNDGQFCHGK